MKKNTQMNDPIDDIMRYHSEQEQLLRGARTKAEIMDVMMNELTPEEQLRVKVLEAAIWSCVERGAPLLFGMTQVTSSYERKPRGGQFFTRVKMRRSGDVAKGTFRGLASKKA